MSVILMLVAYLALGVKSIIINRIDFLYVCFRTDELVLNSYNQISEISTGGAAWNTMVRQIGPKGTRVVSAFLTTSDVRSRSRRFRVGLW